MRVTQEVIACESGPDALAKAPAANADLLLLGDTPVIFMTAKVQATEIAKYRALGALDVIAKPFDPMRVSEQIRRIWSTAG